MKHGSADQTLKATGGSAQPKSLMDHWMKELERWIQRKDREMGGPVSASEPQSREAAGEGES